MKYHQQSISKKIKRKNKSILNSNRESNFYGKRYLKKSCEEKFINLLMFNGKKSKALKIFSIAAYLVRKKFIIDKKTQEKLSLLIEQYRLNKKNIGKDNAKDNGLYIETHSGTNAGRFTIGESSPKVNKPMVNLPKVIFTESEQKKIKFLLKFSITKPFLKSLLSIRLFAPLFNIILKNSINNIKPSIEVRRVRIAGTTYQVPAIISKARQETIAIRWIISAARKRKQNNKLSFSECLSLELIDALNKQGLARQKRDELHKIAEANRAYVRYRWW